MSVRYPKIMQELVDLAKEDQAEIRSHAQVLSATRTEEEKRSKGDLLARHCHIRAHRMLAILRDIQEPTISNIGLEGSKAVAVLALHSYLEVIKKVLALYQAIYKQNPDDIYYQAIPPLVDRVMILEHRVQLFGTNWSMDKDGGFFLIPVKDFAKVNQRRAAYGLAPVRRPVILSKGANKYPLGKGLAKEADQKELTNQEYAELSRNFLRSVI